MCADFKDVTEYVLSHEQARAMAIRAINALPLDGKHVVTLKKVTHSRSTAQNKLAFVWYAYVSSQTGETIEEVRHYCKLTYGVPILEMGEVAFREYWRKVSAVLNYEEQLKAMEWLPVTRLFSVQQFSEYLGSMERGYAKAGYPLPADADYCAAMGIV